MVGTAPPLVHQEVAVTVLGIVLVHDVGAQPWIHRWLPCPQTKRLPAFALRLVLLAGCATAYVGVRAALTAESGTQTLEGSQLLRRSVRACPSLHNRAGQSRPCSLSHPNG